MIKKLSGILIATMIFCGSFASALEETAADGAGLPAEGLCIALQAIERAQYRIAVNLEERIGMQNEFADRRVRALEKTGDPRVVEALLQDFIQHEREIGRLLEDIDGQDTETILELITEASGQRHQRLLQMSERESLPDVAREGMKRALGNQLAASERLRHFFSWTDQAGEGDGNGEGSEESGLPGQREERMNRKPVDGITMDNAGGNTP